MKFKQSSAVFSFLLSLAFIVSFQSISDAQIRIQNDTGCDLYVAANQGDLTTINPCDGCTLVGLNFIPSGGNITLPANISCGQQQWQAVYWTTTFGANFGVSYNPGLGGGCGSDVTGPCGGTNANWVLVTATGIGPAFVSIN